eukprot:TRINITY_DN9946_c0_g1_i1.p1 TRINITY_DN9946_c0_g1~~TRINITY_DN9946_c0_g1_i1.p1  ORF type:complete len:436 (+),score=80.35 TRINITY_DN9946_c0_g1_i1:93-1400(+)
MSRYRIRPPGETNEKLYRWRFVIGGKEKDGVSSPPPQETGGTTFQGDVMAGPWETGPVIKIDGYKFKTGKRVEGQTLVCKCVITYESEDGVADVVRRLTLPECDEIDGERITRRVKWPFLLHKITYHLIRKETMDADGVTTVTYKTNPEVEPDKNDKAFYNMAVKVSKTDGKITLELYDGTVSAWVPLDAQVRQKPETICTSTRRLMQDGDFINGRFGKYVVGMLEQFAESCDDMKNFEVVRQVVVDKIAPGFEVPLYRRPEGNTNYGAFRAEAEMKGSVSLFIKMLENLGKGGLCREKITPENESQEVLIEDSLSRIVRKIDKLGPWPLKKREYLFASIMGFREDGALYLCQKSFTDNVTYPVSSGCVRGVFHEVGFRAVPTKPGYIKVMQLVHADPQGMPKAVVEGVMSDRCYVLGRMKQLLEKPEDWVNQFP